MKKRRVIKANWQVKRKSKGSKKYKRTGDMINKAYEKYKDKIDKGIKMGFSDNLTDKEIKKKLRELVETKMEETGLSKEKALDRVLNSETFSTQEERIQKQLEADLPELRDAMINAGFLPPDGRVRDAHGRFVSFKNQIGYLYGKNGQGTYQFLDPITGMAVLAEYDYSHGTWRLISKW